MKKRFFVTATNTDIGKTYTTKLFMKEFASRGLQVGVLKPIETGVVENAPDGDALLALLQELNSQTEHLKRDDIVPFTYKLPAAPFIASHNRKFDFELLDKAVSQLEELCDILIIEGAGGLYVPIDEDVMMIDLIVHLKAKALLVTHCSLGCINDTLLSQRALSERDIEFSTAFNCRENDKSFEEVSKPYFSHIKQKILKVDDDIDTLCDVMYNL